MLDFGLYLLHGYIFFYVHKCRTLDAQLVVERQNLFVVSMTVVNVIAGKKQKVTFNSFFIHCIGIDDKVLEKILYFL